MSKQIITPINYNLFEILMPYQPKHRVKVGEFMITVDILNRDGETILIKKIGIITNLTTYYKVGA